MTSAAPILFVDHADVIGGAEGVLLSLCSKLDHSRWVPQLAVVQGSLADEAARLGIPTHPIFLPRLRRSPSLILDWIRGARQIADLVGQTGAKIIYTNTVRATFYGVLAARLSRRPMVWHMHDFWLSEARPRSTWPDRLVKGIFASQSHQIIAISHSVAFHLPQSAKVTVIYNGIDPERFDPDRTGDSLRQKYHLPPDAPVVGIVGRLRPWKGQDRFMRIAAGVKRVLPEARFLVVGGSPFGVSDDYPADLNRLRRELDLTDSLIMTGHLDDVQSALASMDIFVHTGDPEPFGLVNVEAMAMKLPLVAYAYGALPEIIHEEETGLLVPPFEEDAFARKIITLLKDPDRRKRMGRAGRVRVEEKFHVTRMVHEIEKILSEIP